MLTNRKLSLVTKKRMMVTFADVALKWVLVKCCCGEYYRHQSHLELFKSTTINYLTKSILENRKILSMPFVYWDKVVSGGFKFEVQF